MFKYAAFLSYAHADEAIAARLHKALETYRAPKTLNVDLRTKLKPIFRDAAELTAHYSLSEKIQDAVTHSRFLIVLCSPSAKASHWVNEEIRLFRTIHGEASILCALAEGTPETSFPPALLEGGREPLAASLAGKDGFRLGVTQLAASMLGVGLDDLLQRDQHRRRRRSQAITIAAFGFSGVMGVTAFTAIEARNDAQANRAQAEDLVEYMITDLKEKLEPVGRLDILDSVGDRAVEYYDAQDIEALSDESLARQARARHILGQVALDAGRDKDAAHEIMAAHGLTKEVLTRNPNDTDAIFAHAQSEYWVGWQYYLQRDYKKAQPYFQAYNDLGQTLYQSDPDKLDWIIEAGWGANNLGMNARRMGNYSKAETDYKNALEYFKNADLISPRNLDIQREIANVYAGLAIVSNEQGKLKETLSYRMREKAIYEKAIQENPNDFTLKFDKVETQYEMLNQRLITDPDLYQEMIKDVKATFEELVALDPNNQYWAETHKAFKDFLLK